MQWDISVNSTDVGGILKRKNPKVETTNNHKDLLIFGYEAKIFREDQKALSIDQGKHLLEWNGEKIDRYDVRATLLDSSQFEPPPGGYGNRLDYLPPEELRAEQLAEEERYYALNHNEEEELMYQEEELKRILHEKKTTYGQVQFDYNEQTTASPETDQNIDISQAEEPEKPYVQPKNFSIPYSILLPDTMNQHIIIEKTARFISGQGPQMEILIKAKQSNNSKFEFLNQSNRFNPYYKFLLTSIKNGTYPENEIYDDEEIKIDKGFNFNSDNLDNKTLFSSPLTESIIPNIVYKPSANCAYTQLISKIKGVPLPEVLSTMNSNSTTVVEGNTIANNSLSTEKQNLTSVSSNVEIKKLSSGLMLAQAYASDTEDETDNDESENKIESNLEFPIPPENIRTVIDKTATYVLKNGKQFEETLRMKGDDRFMFLNENNEFYSYYMSKVNGLASVSSNSKKKQITPVSFSIKPKEDTTVQIKPALPQEGSDEECIQQKDNQTDSVNNTNNNSYTQSNNTTSLPEHVKRAIQLVENQLVARTIKVNNIQTALSKGNMSNIDSNSVMKFDNSQSLQNKNTLPSTSLISTQVLNEKTLMERQKELKLAEEKVKDKLAQIAREKLGLISKEKQLQLERKKKAKAFLNHIKVSPNIIKSKDEKNGDNSDNDSVHSIPISSYGGNEDEIVSEKNYVSTPSELTISTYRSKSYVNNENDTVSVSSIDSENYKSRKNKIEFDKSKSRSRSRSRSESHKRKKTKHYRHHHNKKKSKKRSPSRTRSRSRSFSPSFDQRKRHKSTSSKKSKKHKREKDN